jgi:uncharacterized protein YqeY
MSSIKDKLTEDMKTAMRAKDKDRLGTIRLALAAIKQREVDERIQLDDTQLLAVLDKMVKQRRESISQYGAAGRDDLVAKEQFEIDVLQTYLPAAMSETELRQVIATAIQETGAASVKDMGKLMATLRPQVQGRADMGLVSQIVKQSLPT